MRTAIIGGGIAGLAAAYEFQKARAAGAPIEYTLFESSPRLGGVMASQVVDGAVIEQGPDSFLTDKPAAADLARELGLGADLIGSNDSARKTWIVVRNRLVPLPDGLMFLIPTRLMPTALSPLFSPLTKARMAMDLLRSPRPAGPDESVAALVKRHFGAQAVDRLANPLLSGIFGGDAAELSAHSVLPRLVEMESEFGSLTRGMLAAQRQMRRRAAASPANGNGRAGSGSGPRSVFTTLRLGMQQLADAVATRLPPDSVRLSAPVSALASTPVGWMVESGSTRELFQSVVIATPAWAAAVILGGVDAELGRELAAIPYSSSITVNLVYDESRLGALAKGFGFLVPASEGRSLLACTFVHRKFLGRTPPGKAVLRAFLGGSGNEALLAESDASLVVTVRRELTQILGENVLGAAIAPEHIHVARWRRAMAQYAVGHETRKRRIADRVAALPGLRLAGNAYDGIGISDCIRLGRQAARDLVDESAGQPVSESAAPRATH